MGNLATWLNTRNVKYRQAIFYTKREVLVPPLCRARSISGKAGVRRCYMQHQILAFNPGECSCNGGKMTPERCMECARDYLRARYLDQERVIVLHLKRCRETQRRHARSKRR